MAHQPNDQHGNQLWPENSKSSPANDGTGSYGLVAFVVGGGISFLSFILFLGGSRVAATNPFSAAFDGTLDILAILSIISKISLFIAVIGLVVFLFSGRGEKNVRVAESGSDPVSHLERLKQLRDNGAITQAEFERLKERLIAEPHAPHSPEPDGQRADVRPRGEVPPGPAPKEVSDIFVTMNGHVVALVDGRVIAIRGGRYKVFGSVIDYRSATGDREAWSEMTDPAERATFCRQADAILRAVLASA